jgi:hypothetical protein
MPRKTEGRGLQQAAQSHAEGDHGDRTREFIRSQQIRSRPVSENFDEQSASDLLRRNRQNRARQS